MSDMSAEGAETESDGEEEVEDLDATDRESDDVAGGVHRVPGKYKAGDITITRQSASD